MKTKGPDLVWAGKEPDNELNGEEDHDKVVDHLDDEHHCRILNIASRILEICHLDTADISHNCHNRRWRTFFKPAYLFPQRTRKGLLLEKFIQRI